MSRSFLGIPIFPLQAKVIGKPLLLAKKSSYPPTGVPIDIDWNAQFALAGGSPNVGVTFNLLTSAVKTQLDIIQSVYIDNTASPIPVYVHFPSTGMTISVAPATSDWFPAVTEDLIVQVFVEGLVVGQIPMTQLIFTNVLIPPYSDPELNFAIQQGLASPAITRGNNIFNTNFGIPALGDQTINFDDQFFHSTGGAGTVLHNNLWGTPTTGFIYLTHIDVNSVGNSNNLFEWSIDSLGSSGTLLYDFKNHLSPFTQLHHVDLSGMNIKLDAAKTWQMRVVNNALINSNPNNQGADDTVIIETTFVWSQNPQ
jgi:hypothetical protein